MGEAPLRQCVGREALVKDRDGALEPGIGEVRVELLEVGGHDHALVDERARRQGRHVEERVLALERLLAAPAGQEQPAIERGLVDLLAAVDEHHLHPRQRLERFLAAGVRIRRHGTPAGHLEPFPLDLLPEDRLRLPRLLVEAREERDSRCKTLGQLDTGFPGNCPEEAFGLLQQQAAAVARLAIARHGAAVREPAQGSDRRLDQPVTRLVVHVRDQAEAAAVALEVLPVQAAAREIVWVSHGMAPGSLWQHSCRPAGVNAATQQT